jgi:predicted Rossmann fold nucleotide-binding protein DprA/Smf involved in DNA uptake
MNQWEIRTIAAGDPSYPSRLLQHLKERAPKAIHVIGCIDLLARPTIGIICSVRCPGAIVLQTYDHAQKMKLEDLVVVGGFHSPMERECLEILLRGRAGIVLCPARGLARLRIRPGWQEPLRQGRMVVLSPFPGTVRRSTATLAHERNRCVAALADEVLVPYAAAESKTECLVHDIIRWRKPLVMFDDGFWKGETNLSEPLLTA